jgi:hypothetical protein
MALDPVVNFFRSTIATLPLNSGTTTMVLASGDGNKLPDPSVDGAFNLVVYDPSDPFVAPEIVRCTARTSDTLTISRGQEGTSDATKAAGIAWTVELVPTAKTIQDIDSTKVNVADIVNNLTSTDTNKPLSANQGKVLQDNKVATASIVNDLTSGGTTVPLSAEQGKVLQDGKVAKAGDTMTGTLTATKLIPSGNVTAGNGMYLPATNTVAFSTDGAERVRVDASGDVGIGTSSPVRKLSVNGIINIQEGATERFFINWNATDSRTEIATTGANPTTFFTNSAERLRITSAGDVGIGTTAPASRLDVNGQVTIMSRTRILNKIISTDNSNVTVLTVTAPNVNLFAQIEINIIHSRAPNTLQGTGAHGKFYITIARQLNGNTVALYDSTNSFVASGADGGGGVNSTLNTPTFTSPSGASSATQTIDVQIQASTGGGGTGGQFTLKTELLTTNGSVLIA